MLAVFDHSVAKIPEALKNPYTDLARSSAFKDGSLKEYFNSLSQYPVAVNLAPSAFMAYSSDEQYTLLPILFSFADGILCIFQGHIENVAALKRLYGLTKKTANEVGMVIEAYHLLRDRGPYLANHVLRHFDGKFAFILYDTLVKSIFAAGDADGNVPFFWGTDSDNHFVFSDDETIIKKACLKSYAPFPKGCFFRSSGGLRSFQFFKKELKPTPWINSSGEVCGVAFEVDMESIAKEYRIPRVRSVVNW